MGGKLEQTLNFPTSKRIEQNNVRHKEPKVVIYSAAISNFLNSISNHVHIWNRAGSNFCNSLSKIFQENVTVIWYHFL